MIYTDISKKFRYRNFIEMQVANTRELPKRTRYYQSVFDLQLIEKGAHYSELKPSYIIFICMFDVFKKGRHIYTFENTCKEDKNLVIGDDATKIFLNADSELHDINNELRAFLDYVAGKKSEDTFVKKLEEAVKKARLNKKWRIEFMTLLMRDRENVKKGIEKGIVGAISICRDLGLSDSEILKRIEEKYNLSEKEALGYIQGRVLP